MGIFSVFKFDHGGVVAVSVWHQHPLGLRSEDWGCRSDVRIGVTKQ